MDNMDNNNNTASAAASVPMAPAAEAVDEHLGVPTSVMLNILRYTDVSTFAACRGCNMRMRDLCTTEDRLQPLSAALLVRRCMGGALSVESAHHKIYANSKDPDSIFSAQTKVRLKLFVETASFLKSAAQHLMDVYGVPFAGACIDGPSLLPVASLAMFVDFLQQVRDVLLGLEDDANRQLGDGFDLADLALWRYCFSFEERCENAFKPAAASIKNRLAREWWTSEWGAMTYAIPFADFYPRFFKYVQSVRHLPAQDRAGCTGYDDSGEDEAGDLDDVVEKELHAFLRVFLNFPEDNVMTTYKFDLLDQTLGPMTHLVQNFRAIVLRAGFVGLVNRETANEMIGRFFNHGNNKNLGRPIFVLRFSRTRPHLLVATFGVRKPKKIDVTHRLLDRKTLGGKSKRPVEEVRRDDIKRVIQKPGMGRAAALPICVDNASAMAAAVDFRTAGYDTGFNQMYTDCPSDDDQDGAVVEGGASLAMSGGSGSNCDDAADGQASPG